MFFRVPEFPTHDDWPGVDAFPDAPSAKAKSGCECSLSGVDAVICGEAQAADIAAGEMDAFDEGIADALMLDGCSCECHVTGSESGE